MSVRKRSILAFIIIIILVFILFIVIGMSFDSVVESPEVKAETEYYETEYYEIETEIKVEKETETESETESEIETETEKVDRYSYDGRRIYDCGICAYDDEIVLMAYCVMAEAGNQSMLGKQLVVDVILNRCLNPVFPNNISEVISQRNQFEVYADGTLYSVEPDSECWYVICSELEDIAYPGVMYFRTVRYSDYGTPWQVVGDHYFSTM